MKHKRADPRLPLFNMLALCCQGTQLFYLMRNYDSLIEYTTVTIDLQEVTKETEVSQAPVTLGERMSAPVSYTHLDVYKRQAPALIAFFSHARNIVGGAQFGRLCGAESKRLHQTV